MRELELLSPAGSREALKAALCNGADAVYLGGALFGARASAGLSDADLKDAARLCHLHGRRLYVTVNVLVKQSELPALRKTLDLLRSVRADAVLVQDMGVLRILRREYPELPVHASTQMTIHSAAGAETLLSLGVSRAVFARECDLSALRAAAQTGLEVEAFVHGALCVSVSGQCRLSALAGGRSGNRGRCAQPCRLPYIFDGRCASWLSTRDLCLRDDLPGLAQAGVCAFKIEGRLKGPEYVAVVTRAYRNALDSLSEGRFHKADSAEAEVLSQAFSRTFTRGLAFGARDADILSPNRVSHAGVPVGTVSRAFQKGGLPFCTVRLSRDLGNGDGLQVRSLLDQEIIYQGPDVPAGGEAVLRLHTPASPDDNVARLDSEAQKASARATYEDGLPRIPFDASLSAVPGQPSALLVTDGTASVSVQGAKTQTAREQPLSLDAARRSIGKTGGTAFTLRDFSMRGENAFLPVSEINELRRSALEALADARIKRHPRLMPPDYREGNPKAIFDDGPKLFVRCPDADAAKDLFSAGADAFLYAPRDYTESYLKRELAKLPADAFFCLPTQAGDDTLRMLLSLSKAFRLRITAGSVGQLSAIGQPCMAGEGIPVWNSEASRMLAALGCCWQTLSRESSRSEIADIPKDAAHLILPVYGRARMMLLNHCPARTAAGLCGDRGECRMCEAGTGCKDRTMDDRLSHAFPLWPEKLPEGCVISLLNDRPRNLGSRAERMSWLLDFTLESEDERGAVTRYYRALMDGKNPIAPEINGTAERYLKGVE